MVWISKFSLILLNMNPRRFSKLLFGTSVGQPKAEHVHGTDDFSWLNGNHTVKSLSLIWQSISGYSGGCPFPKSWLAWFNLDLGLQTRDVHFSFVHKLDRSTSRFPVNWCELDVFFWATVSRSTHMCRLLMEGDSGLNRSNHRQRQPRGYKPPRALCRDLQVAEIRRCGAVPIPSWYFRNTPIWWSQICSNPPLKHGFLEAMDYLTNLVVRDRFGSRWQPGER
jgi:hypothetical protein